MADRSVVEVAGAGGRVDAGLHLQAGGLAGIISSIAPKANVMSPLSFYNTPAQYAANQQLTNANNQATTQGAINANLAATNYQNAGIANAITGLAGVAGSVDWSKLGGNNSAKVNYELGSFFGGMDQKSTTMNH